MPLEQETERCSHLAAALLDPDLSSSILKKFKAAATWSARRALDGPSAPKRRKIQHPTCGTCEHILPRPFVCLDCSYSGCWHGQHVTTHLKEAGHRFCVDAKSGAVFCAACDNFVYDASLEREHLFSTLSLEERRTKFQDKNKGREAYQVWEPGTKDIVALQDTVPVSCQGRRGLVNLGQTCFLNVVLQSLVHNPMLRNYFLSDRHNSKLCVRAKDCMCCEFDKLFAEIYSCDTSPFGPTSLLFTTWHLSSAELSGYAQQDAHEFFMATLNHLHAHSKGSTNISCNCVIHSTFAGQLQSDILCARCKTVKDKIDPIYDISLDLGGAGKGKEVTLGECLRRFTHPEKLGSKEYSCECGARETSKRLSIRKLPPVLSFQFKRFEHKSSDKSAARKIDTPVRFPASINMAPYTTGVTGMKHLESDGGSRTKVPTLPGPSAMYEYDLFAVINHEGQLDNGHYTNYARYGDEWYRFDDEKVSHSTLGACLSSSAYMCFYMKRHLDYKPYVRPSYVVTFETEAELEKQREREKEAARNREVEDALLATV